MNKRINISKNTTPNDVDRELETIWIEAKKPFSRHKKYNLTFDISENKWMSLSKVLTVKSVLDKHRENTKKYINQSEVIVQSFLMEKVIKAALLIIKTEHPVYVTKIQKQNKSISEILKT